MTCIIAVKKENKVFLGGDSAGVSGLDIRSRKDIKVFKIGEFLIGYTSSFRLGQILRFKLDVPKQISEQDDYQYMCTTFIDNVRELLLNEGYAKISNNEVSIGTFIIVYRNKIYSVFDDLQVAEVLDDFDSVGCGHKYALGVLKVLMDTALDGKEIIQKALEISTYFSGGVRPPFNIIEA